MRDTLRRDGEKWGQRSLPDSQGGKTEGQPTMDILYKISRKVLELIQEIDPRVRSLILRLSFWWALVGLCLVATRNLPRRSSALQLATAILCSFLALLVPVEQALGVHSTAFGFAFLLCVMVLPFLPVWLSRLLVPTYFHQKVVMWALYIVLMTLLLIQVLIAHRG